MASGVPNYGPKNNLAEQLARHKLLTASTDKRGSVGKNSTFTPPHKPPLSLSFSSKSLPSKTRTDNTPLRPPSSVSASTTPRPYNYSAVRRKTYPVTTSHHVSTSHQVQQHKACPPVAFVAPVVSKATQSGIKPTSYSNEKCVTSLNPPRSVLAGISPAISPASIQSSQASVTSTASEGTRLSPNVTANISGANIPGSSLAFCSVPSSSDSRRHSPRIQTCSKAGVELELEKIRCERMSVMDDICDLLADIPPEDITSLFRFSAGHVQKKLATRKKLLLREESLKIHLESYATGTPLTSPDVSGLQPSAPPTPHFVQPVQSSRQQPEQYRTDSHFDDDWDTDVSGLPPAPPPAPRFTPSVPPVQSSRQQPEQCRTDSPYDDALLDDDWDFNSDVQPLPTPAPAPHFASSVQPVQSSVEQSKVNFHSNEICDNDDWGFNMEEDVLLIEDTPIPHNPEFIPDPQPIPREPISRNPTVTSHSPATSGGSCSSKPTFKPPFRPGGGGRLDRSFKPAGNANQPKDDASEFRGQYRHTREMYKIFNQVFGLKRFRPNQLEAVNAAVLGKDCFVLMPTGGGKSLCYQLPALMTPGVSVVVSPLRSLIQDQVQKLTSLGIPAKHLSSDLSFEEEGEVYASLALREPVTKLLYVTPEKLGASNKLVSTLRGLHNRQMLARFVIDEAHCISQWGHDFRPDYKKLSELRGRFSGVPIVALTATATPRVRADILYQLKMERTCKWFTQSFNRTNLTYLVVPKKPKKAIQDIIELISKSFQGQSGIVYCLSRRDCEIMAGELCRGNIAALCYHAGLSNDERSTVQQRWVQEDRCKVVCATIAFGMGIDKPDVRFVIHHSLPKSVEGYYQEAGRAGRDGMPAQCVLFYNYSDMARLRRMVKAEKLSYEQERVHLNNLYRMVQYCENLADCRRVQLLEYFAEHFDSAQCKNSSTPCDNCQSNVPFVTEDVTDLVKVVVRSVQRVGKDKYTLNQYLDALKGSGVSKIANGELGQSELYGAGGTRTKHDLERLLHMLVTMDVLSESLTIGSHDNVVCYVKTGSKARDVLDGRITGITLKVKGAGKTSARSNRTATKTMSKEDVLKQKCLKELTALRLSVTTKQDMKNPEYVVPSAALQAMSSQLPTSKADMLNVEGYTEIKWDRFEGESFLQITEAYAAEVAKLHTDSTGGSGGTKTSAYFKGNAENRSRPVIGKGKRKKANETSADGPSVKRQQTLSSEYRLPVHGTTDYNSEDEFEMPTKSKRIPLKGLLPHPNNR